MPWDNAQAKTAAASKEAHDAEVYACKAHKHLESVGESQQESERARARLAELERELEGMRTRGVDLSSKQREIEVARRSAEEAAVRAREAHKGCETAEREAAMKEREAAKLQRGLADERRSVEELEAELSQLQRTKGDAMKQHEHHQMLLRDADNKGDKQAEIERLNRELDGHAKAVSEAEAALAAVRERHQRTHTHLGKLKAEWEQHLQARRGLEANFNTTRTRLDDVNERENELSRLLSSRRGQLGEHETAAQRAAQAAEAERARAADLHRQTDPLAREAQDKRAAIGIAETNVAEAKDRQRQIEQRERELQGKLQGQQRTVEQTTADTRQRVEGYEKYKVEAQNANARKEQLWDEAMEHGGVGDRNADSKIAKMENRLKDMNITGTNKGATHTTRETTVVKEE